MLSNDEWHKAAEQAQAIWQSTQMVAEDFTLETGRIVQQMNECTDNVLESVKEKLETRLQELEHWQNELLLKLPVIKIEIDTLLMYKQRAEGALRAISHIMNVDQKILAARNCRTGIDLVEDESTRRLYQEDKIVNGMSSMLQRTLEQIQEQCRLLRKVYHHMYENMKDKEMAQRMDELALSLTRLNQDFDGQSQCCIDSSLEALSNADEVEWLEFTNKHRKAADKVIKDSRYLRLLVDSNLRNLSSDMRAQVCETNESLDRWYRQCIRTKCKLQEQHANATDQVRQVDDMQSLLYKCLENKELAVRAMQMQIIFRNKRPNMEMIRDGVTSVMEHALNTTVNAVAKLNNLIVQHSLIQAALCQTQLELEASINNKLRSIEIEELTVIPLRNTIFFPQF